MAQGDQAIPLTKALMLVANGEIDYASNYIEILPIFSKEGNLTAFILDALTWRVKIFKQNLENQINEGIKLHDAHQYDKAIAHYEAILKQYPRSAWANYERFYSKNAKIVAQNPDKKNDRKEWDLVKPAIFACNPLYPMDVRASNGEEAFLMFRRQQLKFLFNDKKNLKTDLLEYADIIFDLKEYGFAAQLYWLIITSFSEESYNAKETLYSFLYCLNKLDANELSANFQGDFPAEFKKIEKLKKEKMENDAIYKTFQEKN